MFIYLFIQVCASWGPIFHQYVAQEFAKEYLDYLTPTQMNSFISGSVYVDGLSRKQYHNLTNLIFLANEYKKNSTLEYWFTLGFILHMAADCSGHFGSDHSFLPMKVPKHYFAELVVCSAIFHNKKPPPIMHNEVSDSVFQRTRKGSSLFFAIFYRIWRIIVRFPFHWFLGYIQNDRCKYKNSKKYAMCNLELHIQAIKRIMFDTMILYEQGELTSENLGLKTIHELETFQCCV